MIQSHLCRKFLLMNCFWSRNVSSPGSWTGLLNACIPDFLCPLIHSWTKKTSKCSHMTFVLIIILLQKFVSCTYPVNKGWFYTMKELVWFDLNLFQVVEEEIEASKKQVLAYGKPMRRLVLKKCKNLKIQVMDAKDRHDKDVWQIVGNREADVLQTKVMKNVNVFWNPFDIITFTAIRKQRHLLRELYA